MVLSDSTLPNYVQQELDSISTDYQERVNKQSLEIAMRTIKHQCRAIILADSPGKEESAQQTLQNLYDSTRDTLGYVK